MSSHGGSGDLRIGACVMTVNGNMYQGSNMDSPSCSAYGTSISAEDCALFKAYSEGQREIKAIAVHVKHLIKDENGGNGCVPQLLSHSNVTTPSGAAINLISPRLKQQQLDQFSLPELNRLGSNLMPMISPSSIDLKRQALLRLGPKYKAVFQVPNGNWRNTLLLQQTTSPHFVLISCKTENNFTVKSTASLLTNMVLPPPTL
jgi:hypothetical protein